MAYEIQFHFVQDNVLLSGILGRADLFTCLDCETPALQRTSVPEETLFVLLFRFSTHVPQPAVPCFSCWGCFGLNCL